MLISLNRTPKAVTTDRCHTFKKIRVSPFKTPRRSWDTGQPAAFTLLTYTSCMHVQSIVVNPPHIRSRG